MIISVNQAFLNVEQLLPKFEVATATITDSTGQSRLLIKIKVKPGVVNSRGQDLPDGSYKTQEDIALHTGGVHDYDVEEAVNKMKNYIQNYDTSNGWTSLF